MLSQDVERRIEFALFSISSLQDRFDVIDEHLSVLEYAISLISKRIDDLERRSR